MVRAVAAYYVLQAALQWGLFVTVFRLHGGEQAGLYSLALGILSPLIILSSGGLRSSFLRSSITIESEHRYLAVRLVTTVGALAGGFVIAVAFREVGIYSVLGGLWLTKLGDVLAEITQASKQLKGQATKIVHAGIARASVQLLTLLIASSATRSLSVSLMLVGLSSIVVFVLIDMGPRRFFHAKPCLKKGWFRETISDASGVSATQFVDSLAQVLPRYFLSAGAGLAAVAKYTALAQILSVPGVFLSAMATSSIPELARLSAANQSVKGVVIRLSLAAASCTAVVSVLLIIFGDVVFAAVFGGTWSDQGAAFAAASISGGLWYLSGVGNTVAVGLRRDGANLVSTIAFVVIVATVMAALHPLDDIATVFVLLAAGHVFRIVTLAVMFRKEDA